MLDAFGGVVASINADRVMEAAPDMAKAPEGESRFRAGEVDEHLYVAEVSPISWKVIVGFQNSYVTGLGREAVQSAALLGLLCAAIGVALASLLAFSTAHGLDGIARQVQRMRATDLQQIDVPRHGLYPPELRTFIGNFNNLLDRTARMRLAEFEAISRAADTILIVDCDGRITYVNEAGLRLVGDVAGSPLKHILGEGTASAVLSHDHPREWQGDCSVKMSRGGSFDGFLSSSPILEEGKLTSVVVIVHDITREKAEREASAQSEKMITLGELVAGTSHELNNPLAIVTGYADLLLEEEGISPEQRSKIESIRGSALRASNIVHSLLAFARKRKTEKVPTDVNSVIEAALRLKEYDIVTSGIRLERNLARNLPPILVDPYQIQQVLLNVINNAQDATAGTANVPVVAVKSEIGDRKVVIRIEDTGSGISKAELKKVFDPFFTTKPLGKGTGLGLSISYGIVREHGGEIRIQSQPGRGTQVRIELPVYECEGIDTPGEAGAARKVFPKKFLVVDDEAEIVSIMRSLFTRNGSTVDSAGSIEDALTLAQKNEYDFVVTDVKMPRGSGIDLYKKLCAIKPSYRGRIVFLTGDTSNPSTMRFFEEEGAVYFSKPLDFQAMEKFVTSAESQATPD
ncbi:MAG: response regulator [Acidobacteria bacterium]|nr:response regulator [Acidobacteriota bacterium]